MAGASSTSGVAGAGGGVERVVAADLVRSWTISLPRALLTAELAPGMARPLATGYLYSYNSSALEKYA